MSLDRIPHFVAGLDNTGSTEAAVAVVENFARAEGLTVADYLDAVARLVGRSFVSGEMGHDDAMGLIAGIYNALFPSGLVITSNGETLLYQMYWALDEGEYGHESDGDKDPIDARALPAVRRVLAGAGHLAR
jgi:hypothetical protein